eukprot:CAMPEP_0174850040 /NCGR_PEP_ID=MMETSP1114-20130205/18756_1 /TAXON_ID=312471 /ORGANISM="Neobodo designis, Strain CCAP 1951/1" /LENGTH=102 /DNA_ID=CAMNT_0016084463 /DNA_START=37 /DNA_END=345 /DNA_ORIENTATION=+
MAGLVAALDAAAEQHFSDMTLVTVRDALKEVQSSPSEAAATKAVAELTPAQQDTLMKVIYVGLAKDHKNSSVYFRWHAALYEAAGAGAIVRVIADKPPKVVA